MNDYHRPLYEFNVTKDFVTKVLDVPQNHPQFGEYVIKIMNEECVPLFAEDTINNRDSRDAAYRDETIRDRLRKQIVSEMLTEKRLDDDELVRLGYGGAMPHSKVVGSQRKAFYVMGLPASGKSSICGALCDMFGAFLLDSDLVKRKLPEFSQKSGATLVHKESSIITMGGDFNGVKFNSIMDDCFLNGYNICLPKIGSVLKDIVKLFKILRVCGYSIYVILVSLDRKKATQRAFKRYELTNRYVPLSMIFDGYANDPILCYYRLRKYVEDKGHKYVDEMIALSTDVPQGSAAKIMDRTYVGPILKQYIDSI